MHTKMFKSAAIVLAGLFLSVSSAALAADGYGAAATGGAGGSTVTVTTASQFSSAVTSSGSRIVVVSGTITLGGSVHCASNKTIQGANSAATIHGDLYIGDGTSNVIVQNLNFTNPSGVGDGDGITIKNKGTNVFVTHCTFTDCADGELDVTRQSDRVTVSWCRFRYVHQSSHNFVNLIGHDDSFTSDRGFLHVTMHHNWYDINCKERMPRVRFGRVHCYDNYYGCAGNDYCLGVGNECQILLQNGYFDHVNAAWKNYSSSGHQGLIQWTGLDLVSTSLPTWAPNSNVFTPPYSYTLDAAANVKSIVMAGAGPH